MLRLFPLMLKPKVLAFKNRWKGNRAGRSLWFRDGIVVLLISFLAVLSYYSTLWVLQQLENQSSFIYVPPAFLLGLILAFLFVMLTITNTISCLGGIYFSSDLGLILSSPVKGVKFFWSKFFETTLSSSWMTLILLLPVVFAFGVFYKSGFDYYLWALLLLIPYFAIPSAISICIATFFVISIPIRRRKEAVVFSFIMILAAMYHYGSQIIGHLGSKTEVGVADMMKVLSFLSISDKTWTPAYWVSSFLSGILEQSQVIKWDMLILLFSLMFITMAAAYLLLAMFFERGFARASFKGKLSKFGIIKSNPIEKPLNLLFGRQTKTLIEKEFRLLTRDVTQSVQLILLIGICGLYVYSLSIQDLLTQAISIDKAKNWKMFLLSLNVSVEAFVITAMGARFVFPSVSREGKTFWLLRTAPIKLDKVLNVKFSMWFVVIALVSGTVFGTAIYLVTGKLSLALIKLLSNVVLSIGIVGMAVGLGAYFSNFRYEHLGQITTSFGSLVYMVSAIALIILNIMLSSFAYYFSIAKQIADGDFGVMFAVVAFCTFLAILGLNVFVAMLSLRLGRRSLLAEL